MADEFPDQNRITIHRRPDGIWAARIGPPGRGLAATGFTAPHALSNLAAMIKTQFYIFDPTWTPE